MRVRHVGPNLLEVELLSFRGVIYRPCRILSQLCRNLSGVAIVVEPDAIRCPGKGETGGGTEGLCSQIRARKCYDKDKDIFPMAPLASSIGLISQYRFTSLPNITVVHQPQLANVTLFSEFESTNHE